MIDIIRNLYRQFVSRKTREKIGMWYKVALLGVMCLFWLLLGWWLKKGPPEGQWWFKKPTTVPQRPDGVSRPELDDKTLEYLSRPVQHEVFCVCATRSDNLFPGFTKIMHDKLFGCYSDAMDLAASIPDEYGEMTVWTLSIGIFKQKAVPVKIWSNKEWGEAGERINELIGHYADIGPEGEFGRRGLLTLMQRFYKGERTKELYDEMTDAINSA